MNVFMKKVLRSLIIGMVAIGMVTIVSFSSVKAVSTTIVISQVNGGGGGTTGTYFNDYVEIKNISSTPQSLDGLSLMYGSATGQFGSSATNIFVLPTGVSLAPGKYYLVQLGTAGTGGVALPTPDATTGNLSMSGASGKVALANAAFLGNTCGATATPCSAGQLANVIDWLAYGAGGNGPAGVGEGGTAVNAGVAMTSVQGGVRKAGGCTDTDNNNLDFDVITAPVPRNTATTAAPCGGPVAPTQNVVDFNGDGRTDYAVTRNTAGGANGQLTWFIQMNGSAAVQGSAWGLSGDKVITDDFDGDLKSDIAVWRTGAPDVAAFYILQSATNTVRTSLFGQTGDDASVVGDYDGDNKADVAVYRPGASAGLQSFWYYRGSLNNPSGNITYIQWGQNGDFPAPGDYDGDGKNDIVVQRNVGGVGTFFLRQTTAGNSIVSFGLPSDVIVPGDYDGDGKTDIATARAISGQINWFWLPSSGGAFQTRIYGVAATDFITQGDYDGDGKTDVAVFRPLATGFYSLSSLSGSSTFQSWGASGDSPVATYNTH
jgi:hypothetical protein